MRSFYPYCVLIGASSEHFISLCLSLRFSTHCEFLVISEHPPFEMSAYVHMHWTPLNNLEALEIEAVREAMVIFSMGEDVLVEHFSEGESLVGYLKNCAFKIANENHVKRCAMDQDMLAAIVSDLADDVVAVSPEHTGSHIARIDFLNDFEGEVRFIAGTWEPKGANASEHFLFSQVLHSKLQSAATLFLQAYSSANSVFSISLDFAAKERGLVAQLKHYCMGRRWTLYRSVGINVPLLLVQNFMRRKVVTHYFVPPDCVNWPADAAMPNYCFSFDKAYFDLDETLTWQGEPLVGGVTALQRLHEKKISLVLLTRHKKSIQETLFSIGLSSEIFEEVISVNGWQKKSIFVSGASIFIDNEFPERLDVLQRCSVPVLDVDQLDFLIGNA